ncbi:MAG: restriction endonuclease subunit S [Candidatus Aerophobetes bacterium]|nr:restriction endonuclease subunit S [Candidatus Aerophobetes bacterium]
MSDWKEKILGELVSFSKGKLTKQSEFPVDGFIPLINTDAINGKITSYAESNGAVICSKSDVLMLWDGERSGLVTIGYFGVVGSTFSKLRSVEFVDSTFLFYYLDDKFDWIQNQRTGTGVPHVPKNLDKILWVKYPENKTTQRKIARILSTADAVIEKTQAAIAKYKAIKQGMLHDLFTRGIDTKTGKLRPKYQDAPELYKESKLGWIPKEWDIFQINECIDPVMSNVDKHVYENEIKILLCNYMDVYDNRYLSKNISFSNGSVNASEIQRFSLKPQDVIITKDSETPDDIAVPTVVIENIENLICGYHLCILRSKDLQRLNGEFLMLQLQIQEINNQFARKANGSTRYGLTIDAIEKVYIKIPKMINEQIEIAHRLKTFENKIQTEQNYLHKLQQIKAGLMADLLSGKKEISL